MTNKEAPNSQSSQPGPTKPTIEQLLALFGDNKDALGQLLQGVHNTILVKMQEEVDALKTRNQVLEDQLTLLQQKSQTDTVSIAQALKSIVTSAPPRDKLDASPPPAFEGKPDEVESFLAAARLYASLKPNAFSSEKQRMLWLLSYFTSSRSEPWARAEVASIEAGTNTYQKYQDLEELVKVSFSSVSRKEEARHKLRNMKLGQKEGLGAFVNRFRPEAEAASFGDDAAAYFFSAALSQDLVLQLTTMNQGTVPTTTAEWYKVSQTYDHAKALAQNLSPFTNSRSGASTVPTRPATSSSDPTSTPNASKSTPAAMDVDGIEPDDHSSVIIAEKKVTKRLIAPTRRRSISVRLKPWTSTL